MNGRDEAALAALADQARAELPRLTFPDREWVQPRQDTEGRRIRAVVVVGAGQSGLAITHGLRREGVRDVLLLDRRADGTVGVWDDFSRMSELRTPKEICGIEFGLPSLSVQRWYEAAHGAPAWDRLERVPREDWAAYLRWYRTTVAIPVVSDTELTGLAPYGDLAAVTLRHGGTAETVLARAVVLATGHDSVGAWTVPDMVAQALPPERFDHSNGPIDFARFAGQRIGVLGHGASAFDNAVAALAAGAASVDLCFRRTVLPTANPHRYVEFAGFMTHFPALPDAARWAVARHFRRADQPPAEGGFRAALALPGFRMHAGCPWTEVGLLDGAIRVTTPRGAFTFDHLICATGLRPDLTRRPELRHLAGRVVLWGERYTPSPEYEDAGLARYPYLGANYEFQPRDPGDAWVRRVFAFNASSVPSHGPHSTSISGHRHGVPRLLHGVTRTLFLEQTEMFLDGLHRYDAADLVVSPYSGS